MWFARWTRKRQKSLLRHREAGSIGNVAPGCKNMRHQVEEVGGG